MLNDTLVINQNSTGTLTLSGARSGTGGLIKNGTGQVTLNGVGSFTGQTRINEGTILYNASGAIPAASLVTIGDGIGAAGSAVLNLNAAMSAAQALNLTVATEGVVVQNNNRLVRLSAVSGTGELRLNAVTGNAFEITGTGGNTTFSGSITSGIALNSADPATGSRFTKTGASTLTLDGNNTYVSRTFINAGALRAASNTALGTASAGFDNATFVYGTGALQLSNNSHWRTHLSERDWRRHGALRNSLGTTRLPATSRSLDCAGRSGFCGIDRSRSRQHADDQRQHRWRTVADQGRRRPARAQRHQYVDRRDDCQRGHVAAGRGDRSSHHRADG